ncbi:hypothetical protein F5X71_00470 [Nocardia brasiliensis]|uniref:Uncharacterized protein n=1 Tax=Nocardia brasiliensis TaxID=37326 RepID=A0A6G9XJB5_NOCBR|nr:hypothetical protein [Nocardia brasiliensis]QIS01006.1 hypothetical protein F5X71_00470 [Nocardia brasiliensis]
MRWPGADAKVAAFPGPDAREARFPGPDRRGILWPTPPTFAIVLTAEAFGVGSASATVSAVSRPVAAATGAGIGSASVRTALAITAPAAGSGAATAAYLPSEVAAAAAGSGAASATVLPQVAVAASAAGAGLAAAAVRHAAIVEASAVGSGTAAASVTTRVAVPAVAVGSGAASATVVVGYRYSDNFNRADAATLGADWRVDRNASPKIATNRAQMKTMANGDGRAGCWTSYQGGGGTQGGRFATDKYGVKIQFIAPTGNTATDNFTGAVLAVADTFGAGVMCYFVASTGLGCAIYTQSGAPPTGGVSTGQTGQTQRAATATNAALTDVFDFRRERNTGNTADVFRLYRNGDYTTPFLSWEDSGGVVSSGATNRRWGLVTEGNYPLFQSEFRAPAVDAILDAYDL